MRRKKIFLSDVHIGSGSATNWYQDKYHWENLHAIFQYILENGKSIEDLVLLGDFVDQWTELPQGVYPALTEIMAADNNRKIFSLLKECLVTVENIFYLNGNHDM
jgi:UDP-2,3-diacylglucosamine pyrophosphatase LpxH